MKLNHNIFIHNGLKSYASTNRIKKLFQVLIDEFDFGVMNDWGEITLKDDVFTIKLKQNSFEVRQILHENDSFNKNDIIWLEFSTSKEVIEYIEKAYF